MMTSKHDEENHLTWLVNSRSKNQKACMDLFMVMRNHEPKLSEETFEETAQALVAVGFSLWRAVFLADNNEGKTGYMADAEAFLGNLILNNSVAYPQDRLFRNWTFGYYLNNSRYRLEALATIRYSNVVAKEMIRKKNFKKDNQARWTYYHLALEAAIQNFERLLAAS